MRDEHIETIMRECLGKAIREHRVGKMTQGELAGKLGKKYGSAVSEIENGKKMLTKRELVLICEKLKVPVLDVIDRSFLHFREEMAKLGGDKGGFLLERPPVTREEVESGFVSLTGNANEWMSKYLQFAYPPTDTELLRHNLRKAPEREGSFSRQEQEQDGSRQDEE